MVRTHKESFNIRHGFARGAPHSLAEIATISKMPLSVLREVYARGVGAFRTNPASVRPHVKSEEQWAQARVYSFVDKLEAQVQLNHDTDLARGSVLKRG